MNAEEHPLTGGRVTPGIVRVGDTVLRPPKANAAAVFELLDHCEAMGFAHVPRSLGRDEQGRQVLTFLSGSVPDDLAHFRDDQLQEAARLLRGFHDATAPLARRWKPRAEVVCHNDWGPTNTVFRDGLPWGMIDFDTIAPGLRLWDLGYSAALWLDLGNPDGPGADYSGTGQLRRLAVFAEAYGHAECTVPRIAAFAVARQTLLAQQGRAEGKQDLAGWAAAAAAWTALHVLAPLHGTPVPDVAGNSAG